MAPKNEPPLRHTMPSPYDSPIMLVLSFISISIWSFFAMPFLCLKAALNSMIALPIAFLKLSQFKKAKVKPGDGYAIITGASSGIGADMARELARRGYDMILVARRIERMDELAKELHSLSVNRAKRKIDVRALQCDLTQPGQVHKLCSDLESTPVIILVNNAGFGAPDPFCEKEFDALEEIYQVHVRALTELTHTISQRMVRAGRGHILNTVSIAGFTPAPVLAIYHATKKYGVLLSEALNFELRNTGVTVTALCPGPVATEFFESGQMPKKSPMARNPLKLSSSFVAATGIRAMFHGAAVVVPGMLPKLMVELQRTMPSTFQMWFNLVGFANV